MSCLNCTLWCAALLKQVAKAISEKVISPVADQFLDAIHALWDEAMLQGDVLHFREVPGER